MSATTRHLDELLQRLEAKRDRVDDFLAYHRNQVLCPVYASVDVRRNAHKAAVVDANAFPAGFNNLAQTSRDEAATAIRSYFTRTQPQARSILVLAEGHSRNAGYFQNLKTLQAMFTLAGYETVLGTLNKELFPQADVAALDGSTIRLHGVAREGDELIAGGVVPDVVVLNNDLAEGSPDILDNLLQPVTPPPSMGWFRRRKREHFRIANAMLQQLGASVGFDPWLVSTTTQAVAGIDFRAKEGLDQVARAVDDVVAATQDKYDLYGIRDAPHVFVKADPGTYGMGITVAESGAQFLELNSRERERMDRGKGKVKTESVIVQEGVVTDLRHGPAQDVAEPVVYMVCGRVVGGFHRIHAQRGTKENLNSPGARFEPFVMDAQHTLDKFLGEVASIATGYELRFADRIGQTIPIYS